MIDSIYIIDGQSFEGNILDEIVADNIISDNHKKSLKGSLETYDFIAKHDDYVEHLAKRNRLVIEDEDGSFKEFVIYEAAKYLDSEGRKTQVFAHGSYLELKKASVIAPESFKGTPAQHMGRALNGSGWQIGIIEVGGNRTVKNEGYSNPFDKLKMIANEFDGELRFRVEHNGNKVVGRYVDLLVRIGDWTGREVEFGKDLMSIKRTESQDIVTALLGIGPEDEDEEGVQTRIEVLVTDDEALQRWGRIEADGSVHHLIEPYEIESEDETMTEADVERYTRMALDKRINTQVMYETTIADLEGVAGLEHETIRFGDTIRIKDTNFVPPLFVEARIFEINRSIVDEFKKDIKLGDYVEYTQDEVDAIWKKLQRQIKDRITTAEMIEYTYNKLTIDNKDTQIYEDGKSFAEATGIEAKEYAETKANEAENTAKQYAVSQDTATLNQSKQYTDAETAAALQQAKNYAVAKTVYDNKMLEIADELGDKAGLDYVDGKLVAKADKADTYTIEDVDGMINNVVSKTQYTTDMNGIVQDLSDQSTRIGQNTTAIGLRAKQTDLNQVENTLSDRIGDIEVRADGIDISVGQLESAVQDRIKSTVVQYYLSTSSTTPTGGSWKDTAPTWDPAKYVFSRTKTTMGNDNVVYSPSANGTNITGAKGADGSDGNDGVSVTGITNYYLASASSSGVTTSTSGWTTTVQSPSSSKKYLWNYEKISYSNNTSTNTTPTIVGNFAQDGAGGSAGRGITSITEYFKVSSSNSTAPTGTWLTTPPATTTSNKYLWNYEVIKYTDNATEETAKRVIGTHGATGSKGADGADGTDGQSVDSITPQFYLSNSKTSQTGSSWKENPDAWVDGKYMWTRNKVVYKTPAKTEYTAAVLDRSFEAIYDVKGEVTSLDASVIVLAGQVALKASQASVNSLTGRVSNAEGTLSVLPGQIDAKVSKDGVIGAINLTPESSKIQAKRITIDGTTTFASGYDPSKIEIGGTNLISVTDLEQGTFKDSTGEPSGSSSTRVRTKNFIPITSKEITFSTNDYNIFFWVWGYDDNETLIQSYGSYNIYPEGRTLELDEDITQIKILFRFTDNLAINPNDILNGKVKAEKGNKATGWSPAPEDNPALNWVYQDTTEIDGGNIRTGTIDANRLKANSIIAGNIMFKGTLSGASGTFQTLHQETSTGEVRMDEFGLSIQSSIGAKSGVDVAHSVVFPDSQETTGAFIGMYTMNGSKKEYYGIFDEVAETLVITTKRGINFIATDPLYEGAYNFDRGLSTTRSLSAAGIETAYTNNYIQADGEVRIVKDRRASWGDKNYADIHAKTGIFESQLECSGAISHNRGGGTHFYFRPKPGGEARVTEAMGTSTYRPMRASSFPTSSSILTKTNIERLSDEEAVMLLDNADVFTYHIKSNVDEFIFDKRKIGMISEMTPPAMRDENGVDPYSIVSALWQNVKIIKRELEELKDESRY